MKHDKPRKDGHYQRRERQRNMDLSTGTWSVGTIYKAGNLQQIKKH